MFNNVDTQVNKSCMPLCMPNGVVIWKGSPSRSNLTTIRCNGLRPNLTYLVGRCVGPNTFSVLTTLGTMSRAGNSFLYRTVPVRDPV
eukprot:191096-Chlamydomonas_euryale.AAC.1